MRRSARWRVKVFRLSPPSRILAIHLAILAGVLGILVLPPVPLSATVQEFYVAPNGRPDGDGSKERPWDLATALAHPAAVKPGDTIWVRGGVYRGVTAPGISFKSTLTGTAAAPITVRAYAGERAVLDGVNGRTIVLWVTGQYTRYWGLEFTDSHPDRFADRPNAVHVRGSQNRFINTIIHDTGQGFEDTDDSIVGNEFYGNLIYFVGEQGSTRGHGHGVYTHNAPGAPRKLIKDNILFQGFSHGIHAYTSSVGSLDNLQVEGNIVFNNGELAAEGFARNILVGGSGGVVAQNPVLLRNYLYFPPADGGGENNLGYTSGCRDAVVRDNQFIGGGALTLNNCMNVVLTGNTFYGRLTGFTPAAFPENTYHAGRPTGVRVFVRPNQYESGRAHIAVYNWDLGDFVDVDVSSVLTSGARYEVRHAQDYFGPPVLTGTYTGLPLRLPMRGLRVAAPIGNVPYRPNATGPQFAAFVLIRRGG